MMNKDIPKSGPEDPQNLEANAQAYFRNAESFRKKHQQRSMRECYEKALDLGSASETPDGLAIASEASLYLGHIAKTRDAWGLALERYKESLDLGRRSKTPAGLYAAARAAWNLGNTYEEAGMDGFESAFRDAIQMGRESKLPDALEVGAKAAFNLAANIEPEEGTGSKEDIENTGALWRDAIELGTESGTKDGVGVAAKAKQYLEDLLERKETS
ncbi:MAG: hypothetical protein ACTSUB_06210 [Candidatus Thorarchaeota archaeon]